MLDFQWIGQKVQAIQADTYKCPSENPRWMAFALAALFIWWPARTDVG